MNTIKSYLAILFLGIFSTTLLAQTSGPIFINGSNVGIGTTTPSQALDVIGTIQATQFIGDGSGLRNLPAGSTVLAAKNETASMTTLPPGVWVQEGPGESNTEGWTYRYGTKLTVNGGGESRNFEVVTTTIPNGALMWRQMAASGDGRWQPWQRILAENLAGNIGIGTTTPTEKLEVIGTIQATRFIGDGSGLRNLPAGSTVLAARNEVESVKTLPAGVWVQEGPGGSNPQGWTYRYGTKLTVNTGSEARNFELMNTTYPNGELVWRQMEGTGKWQGWQRLITATPSGNVSIGEPVRPGYLVTVGSPGLWVNAQSGSKGITAYRADSLYFNINMDSTNTYLSSAPSQPIVIQQGTAERLRVAANGNVGIGTTVPKYLLSVNGTILSKQVLVSIRASDWADDVFEPHYTLRPLPDVEAYIKEHKHLPGISSADELEKNNLNLAKMNADMIRKIEELTLYIIELNKKIDRLECRHSDQY